MAKYFMTKSKYDELEEELKELVGHGREEVANELDQARKEGENKGEDSNYGEILDKQRNMEDTIATIAEQLKNAVIIEQEKTKKENIVQLGSVVIVEFMGKQDKFTIVGELEADPLNGKISNESPVGNALMNKKEGDTVEVKTPVVKMKYKIIEVI